ncbi:hypothetical protein D3C87_1388830 [compost metagenome]
MELGAENVVAANAGSQRPAIVGRGNRVRRVVGLQMIGVDEIGVQAIGARLDTLEQRVGPGHRNGVPAHMRDFQCRVGGGDLFHGAGDPAQALGHHLFAAFAGQQLHADANAQERHAALDDALVQHLDHAGHGLKARHAIGKGADTGQHDAVGRADHIGVCGHGDDVTLAAFGGDPLKGLGGGAQIARAIVDNGNRTHALPSMADSRAASVSMAKRCPAGRKPRRRQARRCAPGAAKPQASARRI